jgi:S1-C subfamily serine protease
VAGNPSNFDFTVSKGIIGAIRSERLQYDARVDFGSSGGVMANLSGDVVGVVVEKAKYDAYIAYAVPYNRIKQFIERADLDGNRL